MDWVETQKAEDREHAIQCQARLTGLHDEHQARERELRNEYRERESVLCEEYEATIEAYRENERTLRAQLQLLTERGTVGVID